MGSLPMSHSCLKWALFGKEICSGHTLECCVVWGSLER
uniref:Uncharacterized protein n=1 Tax=Anguilla anguilla TaxID=7936 RepID=A0A0E9PW68_ANGAN